MSIFGWFHAALFFGVAAIWILLASLAAGDTALDTEEQSFVQLLNDYRSANNVPPLLVEPTLQIAAEGHSADMGEQRYFSHTSLDGRSPWDRMCDAGYCFNTYKAENIAAGFATGQGVFTAWQNSSGHNAVMLGLNYRVMGIARVFTSGSPYGWYWTNDFGGHVTADAYPAVSPTATVIPPLTATPTPSPAPCPLDHNGDRVINTLDLTGYVDALNSAEGDPRYRPELDLNGNGVINTLDLIGYASRLNTPC